MATSGSHRTALVGRKLAIPVEAILFLSGGVGVVIGSEDFSVWMLVVWMVAALAYLIIAARKLLQALGSSEQNQIQLPGDSPRRGTWGKSFQLDVLVIGSASTMGVISAVMVTRNADSATYSTISKLVAAICILLAWTLLQVGFSRLYADTWHQKDSGQGLDFPKMEEPGLVEFTYFAFGVGTAFQNSDVVITKSNMRMLVMVHSVASFLYSTVLLAFVVAMVAGG